MSNVRAIHINEINDLEDLLLNTLKANLAMQNKPLLTGKTPSKKADGKKAQTTNVKKDSSSQSSDQFLKTLRDRFEGLLGGKKDNISLTNVSLTNDQFYKVLKDLFDGIIRLRSDGTSVSIIKYVESVTEQLPNILKTIPKSDSGRAEKVQAIENLQFNLMNYVSFLNWKKGIAGFTDVSDILREQSNIIQTAKSNFANKAEVFGKKVREDFNRLKNNEVIDIIKEMNIQVTQLGLPQVATIANNEINALKNAREAFNSKVKKLEEDLGTSETFLMKNVQDDMTIEALGEEIKKLEAYKLKLDAAITDNKPNVVKAIQLDSAREDLENNLKRFKDEKKTKKLLFKEKLLGKIFEKRMHLFNDLKNDYYKMQEQFTKAVNLQKRLDAVKKKNGNLSESINYPDFLPDSIVLTDDETKALNNNIAFMESRLKAFKAIEAENKKLLKPVMEAEENIKLLNEAMEAGAGNTKELLSQVEAENKELLNRLIGETLSSAEQSDKVVRAQFASAVMSESSQIAEEIMAGYPDYDPDKVDTDGLEKIVLLKVPAVKNAQEDLKLRKDRVNEMLTAYKAVAVRKEVDELNRKNATIAAAIQKVKLEISKIKNIKIDELNIFTLEYAKDLDKVTREHLEEVFKTELRAELGRFPEGAIDPVFAYNNAKQRFESLAYTALRYKIYDDTLKGPLVEVDESETKTPKYLDAYNIASDAASIDKKPNEKDSHLTAKIRIKNHVLKRIKEVGTSNGNLNEPVTSYGLILELAGYHVKPETQAVLGAKRDLSGSKLWQAVLNVLTKFTPGFLWSVRGKRVNKAVSEELGKGAMAMPPLPRRTL